MHQELYVVCYCGRWIRIPPEDALSPKTRDSKTRITMFCFCDNGESLSGKEESREWYDMSLVQYYFCEIDGVVRLYFVGAVQNARPPGHTMSTRELTQCRAWCESVKILAVLGEMLRPCVLYHHVYDHAYRCVFFIAWSIFFRLWVLPPLVYGILCGEIWEKDRHHYLFSLDLEIDESASIFFWIEMKEEWFLFAVFIVFYRARTYFSSSLRGMPVVYVTS